MILHMVGQWLRNNMHQRLYSQSTPHISTLRVSYGLFLLGFGENWPRFNDTALQYDGCLYSNPSNDQHGSKYKHNVLNVLYNDTLFCEWCPFECCISQLVYNQNGYVLRADFRHARSQWETALLCNKPRISPVFCYLRERQVLTYWEPMMHTCANNVSPQCHQAVIKADTLSKL